MRYAINIRNSYFFNWNLFFEGSTNSNQLSELNQYAFRFAKKPLVWW